MRLSGVICFTLFQFSITEAEQEGQSRAGDRRRKGGPGGGSGWGYWGIGPAVGSTCSCATAAAGGRYPPRRQPLRSAKERGLLHDAEELLLIHLAIAVTVRLCRGGDSRRSSSTRGALQWWVGSCRAGTGGCERAEHAGRLPNCDGLCRRRC